MSTITLPSEVILDVLKFVPYENATKLVLTSKNWAEQLQIQLKEQRVAIIAEIRRLENGLESSDLGEKHREIKSVWDGLVQDEAELHRNFGNYFGAYMYSISEQTAQSALFNQRLQIIQADRNAAYDQYCAIARKRQPLIYKLESLESKLNQCGKPETESFDDLKRRTKCYYKAMSVISFSVLMLFSVGFLIIIAAILIIIIDFVKEGTSSLGYHTLLIVSGIVVVLSLSYYFASKVANGPPASLEANFSQPHGSRPNDSPSKRLDSTRSCNKNSFASGKDDYLMCLEGNKVIIVGKNNMDLFMLNWAKGLVWRNRADIGNKDSHYFMKRYWLIDKGQ
ncbi:hypothetical protein DdX_15134 [Ditylenchus destructor]|uniref:F-box domain-containing protein n=1 Tax=Ditylenchus destructor TaxID=166010 RepID=A0AAD4MRJ8_9BILA|nr:hypothetical protein DdX_15134 [Ditylenchus destructor]